MWVCVCVRAYVRACSRANGLARALPRWDWPGLAARASRPAAPPRPAGPGAGNRSSLPPGGGKARGRRSCGWAGPRRGGAWRRWVVEPWVLPSLALGAAVPCGFPSTWLAPLPGPGWFPCRRSPRGPFLRGLSFQELGVGCVSLRWWEKLAEMSDSRWERKQRTLTLGLQRGIG